MDITNRALLQRALTTLEACVTTCFDRYSHEQVMSQPDHFVNQTLKALRDGLAQPIPDLREGLVPDFGEDLVDD